MGVKLALPLLSLLGFGLIFELVAGVPHRLLQVELVPQIILFDQVSVRCIHQNTVVSHLAQEIIVDHSASPLSQIQMQTDDVGLLQQLCQILCIGETHFLI